MTQNIKQFKLSNDDEIICEVIEWDTEDNSAIITRGMLRIIQGEDIDKGLRFFAFRPWMGFAEDPNTLHTLNSSHILGEVTPSESLLQHYARTIQKLLKLVDMKKHDFDMDKLEGMDEEELEEFILSHMTEEEEAEDELGENIVKFRPPKDKLH